MPKLVPVVFIYFSHLTFLGDLRYLLYYDERDPYADTSVSEAFSFRACLRIYDILYV